MNKFKIGQQLTTDACGICVIVAIYQMQASDLKRKTEEYGKYCYLVRTNEGSEMLYTEEELSQ